MTSVVLWILYYSCDALHCSVSALQCISCYWKANVGVSVANSTVTYEQFSKFLSQMSCAYLYYITTCYAYITNVQKLYRGLPGRMVKVCWLQITRLSPLYIRIPIMHIYETQVTEHTFSCIYIISLRIGDYVVHVWSFVQSWHSIRCNSIYRCLEIIGCHLQQYWYECFRGIFCVETKTNNNTKRYICIM